MKINKILTVLLIIGSTQSYSANLLTNASSAGDDGNPTTQGNGAYAPINAEASSTASKKSPLKASSAEPKAFFIHSSAIMGLCIKDEMNKPHTLSVKDVTGSWGNGNPDTTPEGAFNKKDGSPTTIIKNRQICRWLVIQRGGGAQSFTLIVDGVNSVKIIPLARYNDFADPSNVTYLLAAKLGGPLIGTNIITDGYASGSYNSGDGRTTFRITGENLK